jgi:tyrosyl-tRNA synthetase
MAAENKSFNNANTLDTDANTLDNNVSNLENIHRRLSLITSGIRETIGIDELREKMLSGKQIKGYWGTAPTKSPSIGYLIPLMKFRDMIRSGIDMDIFIADVHAFLDKGSEWIDRTTERVEYYKFLIKAILEELGVEKKDYNFILGSEVQLDKRYIMDLFKLLTHITVNQAQRAGSDVVKQQKDPTLGNLIYPLMQAIDETVLDADVELGGLDQRKIFALSRDYIEELGYNKCTYLMNELLPSLSKPGHKMSATISSGKIDFTDTKEKIDHKIKKAHCVEGESDNNPCMMLAKLILFPLGYSYLHGNIEEYEKKSNDGLLSELVNDSYRYEFIYFPPNPPSRPVRCTTYEQLECLWKDKHIRAQDLKKWLAECINSVVSPIREKIDNNKELYERAFL